MKQHWQSEHILINGNRHFVRWTDNGRPALFLIHGFTDSGRYWSRLAADLESQFSIYIPDMLGHGQSSPLPHPVGIEAYAAQVSALMERLGVPSCHICGHSMGGLIASTVTTSYPEKVQSLILEDPAWSSRFAEPPIYLGQFEDTLAWRTDHEQLRKLSFSDALQVVSAEREGWHADDLHAFLEDRLAYDPAIFDQIDFALGLKWEKQMSQTVQPTLLVRGEAELGSIVDAEKANRFLSLAANGEAVRIAGAGHGIHREKYEPFRDAVTTFLNAQLSSAP